MKIGFVGVGNMGHGMCLNLLKSPNSLGVIAHKNRGPIQDLVGKGAQEFTSLSSLAKWSQTIILCVSNTKIAKQVINDLTPFLSPGMLIIDTTTNDPAGPAQMSAQLAKGNVGYVEAPLTGGVEQARQGILGAIVGCEKRYYEPAAHILSYFCKHVEYFGPVGMGAKAKLVSNLLALGTATLVVETFKQARNLGVDWAKLYKLAQLGSGNSVGLQRILDAALRKDYCGYVFSVKNTEKDLSYICDLLEDTQSTSEIAKMLHTHYQTAIHKGHGDLMLSQLLDPNKEI